MTASSHIRRIALSAIIGCAGLAAVTSRATALPIDFRSDAGTAAAHMRQAAGSGLTSSSAGGDQSDGGVRTLQVTLRYGPDSLQTVDVGAPGPSVGDRVLFAADAFRNGQQVGVGAGDCVVVRYRLAGNRPDTRIEQCVATLSLPQGQIMVQWLIDRIRDPQPAKLALTGGTGAFRTAHGEMIASEPDAQGIEPLTLRLILGES
jgi:hypothetical protein